MEDADQIDTPSEEEIQSRFVQVMERHLAPGERPVRMLLSPAVLAGGLLLVERELEVTGGAGGPSDRYTKEALVESLDDMGVNANGAVTRAISEMTKSGFIEVTDAGRLVARPALTAFKERLDAAFPRMQGLNLVAYLIQTVDEVVSGRKGLDVALDQFDQTLELQKKDSSQAGQKRTSVIAKNGTLDPRKKRANAQTLKSALTRRLRRRGTGAAPVGHARSGDPVVFSAGGGSKPAQVKDVRPSGPKIPSEEVKVPDRREVEGKLETPDPLRTSGHESVDETPPDRPPAQEADVLPTPNGNEEIPKTTFPPFPDAESDSPTLSEPVADSHEGGGNLEDDKEPLAGPEHPLAYQKDPAEIADDSVQRRFLRTARRETGSVTTTKHLESLHSTGHKTAPPLPDDPSIVPCPVCDTGQIREQRTEKARAYFTCSNPDCVFVSWGRPHARVCPSCGNPYLVEATGKAGESVLTCPRATCRYHQQITGKGLPDSPSGPPIPGAKKPTRSVKRMVRRRVIRKKH